MDCNVVVFLFGGERGEGLILKISIHTNTKLWPIGIDDFGDRVM